MALFLTPRFAPAYEIQRCNPFGCGAPAPQRAYSYRVSRSQPRHFVYPSSRHFLTEIDELLSEINHEAQRQARIEAQRQVQIEAKRQAQIEAKRQAQIEAQHEAQRQRQQREHALCATFSVNQNKTGWQLDDDLRGFEQSNVNIEVLDEHTVKVTGNTEWRSEAQAQPEVSAEQQLLEEAPNDKITNATPVEAEAQQSITEGTETESVRPDTPSSSTGSLKSYQAFVEDDFEDLAAEASSLFSIPSGMLTSAEAKEFKSKGRVVEESTNTERAIVEKAQPETLVQQAQQHTTEKEERPRGFFEQTFTFPERINVKNVSATFRNNVLQVTVPKGQAPQIRRIVLM